jgi:hypothetical protein
MEPILFATIGTSIVFSELPASTIPLSLLVVCTGKLAGVHSPPALVGVRGALRALLLRMLVHVFCGCSTVACCSQEGDAEVARQHVVCLRCAGRLSQRWLHGSACLVLTTSCVASLPATAQVCV